MKTLSSFLAVLLFFLAGGAALADDTRQTLREYRPLEAKKISIRLSGRVDSAGSGAMSAEQYRSLAWRHFDRQDWAAATDCFLSALEQEPGNVETAEALAMSVYRSGEYASAYRLGEELSGVMPSVRRVVGETVLADVRALVAEEKFAVAGEFLSHFPGSGGSFAEARQLVAQADTLVSALGPGGDLSPEPGSGAPKKLAKN